MQSPLILTGADMSVFSILVVSDNHDNRLAVANEVGRTGLVVTHADNVFEAAGKMAEKDFPLIVIECNDWAAHSRIVAELGAARAEQDLKLLFLMHDPPESSHTFPEDSRTTVDYVVKPFHTAFIRQKIEVMLKHMERGRQLTEYAEELDEKNLELEVLRNELAEKNEMLEAVSSRDGLTGLFNRQYFDDNLAKEWKQAVRSESSLALLLIDIDFFRKYNKTYGHLAGDDCLRQVGLALYEALLRPVDIIARYQGEVFAAILPDTDSIGAEKVAIRMRGNVNRLALEHESSIIVKQVTVTIGGVALVPRTGMTLARYFERAEQFLAQAKEAGRNCHMICQDWGMQEW